MVNEPKFPLDEVGDSSNLFALALLSFVVGAFAGLVASAFRLLLRSADDWRAVVIAQAHPWGWLGLSLVVGGVALVAALAAWLVFRVAPQASGSGIPHVEQQFQGGSSGEPLSIIAVKFFGGVLAIGGGFALGREGPTVQMGGSIGQLIGRAFRRTPNECRILLAAGAGAGLATAFNAPIAGAVFVLEELVGSFDIAVTVATLGASASAIAVSRVFFGQSPDFHVPVSGFVEFGDLPVSMLFGIAMGFVGVIYNRIILAALKLSASFSHLHGTVRAGAIGASVGLIGWFAPSLIGGGDNLTQQALDAQGSLAAVASTLALRFLLGPLCYAARTPGGLFAPMITIGSQAGFVFFLLWSHLLAFTAALPQQFAIVGMASIFAAVVRAPVTGIILAVELTGSFSLFLPLLGATFAAAATARLLKDPPIYESLRRVH